jgi:hypothetical protein
MPGALSLERRDSLFKTVNVTDQLDDQPAHDAGAVKFRRVVPLRSVNVVSISLRSCKVFGGLQGGVAAAMD